MKKAVRLIVALILALITMGFLGRFCDAHDVPVFHTWGLLHGSFVLVWPAFTAIFYFPLGAVPFFKKQPNQTLEPTR